MRLICLCLSILAAWANPASAGAAPAAPVRMTQAQAEAVQRALNRGTLIYAYDQAAWHGTDDLRAKLPDLGAKVGGWIVDGTADAPQLVFYDKDAADPHAVYIASFEGTRLASSRLLGPDEDRSLSPARKAMVAAQRAAAKELAARKVSACAARPFNTVVLPPEAPGSPTLVYFLTPQTRQDAIPMGGHYRVEVAADGRAGKLRPFTRSCLEMPFAGPQKPEALIVSHLLDETPTEVHVFSSLAAHLPIYVATTTNKRLWVVEGHRIRILDTKKR